MSSESPSLHDLQLVTPKRHNGSSLSIHPYFGKVDPALATKAIQLWSAPGDVVLDPFCGSGTVVHDAVMLGRNVVGWDSSPLAVMISSAKILGMSTQERASLLAFVDSSCPEIDSDKLFATRISFNESSLPEMPRVRAISDWFSVNALRELAHLRGALEKAQRVLEPVVFMYAKLAFSRIITAASLQKGESSYCRTIKPDTAGRVFKLYRQAVASIVRAATAFTQGSSSIVGPLRADRLKILPYGFTVEHSRLAISIQQRDSRNSIDHVDLPPANLVVTSPPYLMSWDYGLYHKFRFYWLNLDLDTYEDTEIGRHLRRKKDDVPRYIEDMKNVFSVLANNTTSAARLVMVNAPSVVYGEKVNTNEILGSCARNAGWEVAWEGATIDIPGPHHGMYGSLTSRGVEAPGAAGKKEHVLVFWKVV